MDRYLHPAIVMRRDLRSIRDLRASHLPLLKRARDVGVSEIEKR